MDSNATADPFGRILDEKRLTVKTGQGGLTLQDYMAKPVAVRTRMAADVPERNRVPPPRRHPQITTRIGRRIAARTPYSV